VNDCAEYEEHNSRQPHGVSRGGSVHDGARDGQVFASDSLLPELTGDQRLVSCKIDSVSVNLTSEGRDLAVVDASDAVRSVDLAERVDGAVVLCRGARAGLGLKTCRIELVSDEERGQLVSSSAEEG
jgi:hypothetical protein